MNICVVGSGYVGLVVVTCFADLGNYVICVNNDAKKIVKLRKGIPIIFEQGLKDLMDKNIQQERLRFSTSIKQAVRTSKAIFIAVGTPPGKDHRADLTAVRSVAADIGRYMNDYKVVVTKSTVPVGTASVIKRIIHKNQKKAISFDVVSNPEFLREGNAIKDFFNPDRIVIGIDSKRAEYIMRNIYRGIVRTGKPLMITDVRSAEMIKYASNAFLATKISFVNEIARLSEGNGAGRKDWNKIFAGRSRL